MRRLMSVLTLVLGFASQFGCICEPHKVDGPNAGGKKAVEDDSSIIVTGRHKTNGGFTTEEGTAFDKATLFVGGYKKLIIPDSATIIPSKEAGKLVIEMETILADDSHPGRNVFVKDAREEMGCAVRVEDNALLVGTFGEGSHFEGGRFIKMTMHVPPGIEVERRSQLGYKIIPDEKRGHGVGGVSYEELGGQNKRFLTKTHEGVSFYWCPPEQSTDWYVIPTQPNPRR